MGNDNKDTNTDRDNNILNADPMEWWKVQLSTSIPGIRGDEIAKDYLSTLPPNIREKFKSHLSMSIAMQESVKSLCRDGGIITDMALRLSESIRYANLAFACIEEYAPNLMLVPALPSIPFSNESEKNSRYLDY